VPWPVGTLKERVVVAPTTGTLVPVEGEVVLVVEGADDPDVVVGAFAAGWRALAQLLATIATATTTIPVVALRLEAQRVARRCCPRAGGRRR
jgi:hypothetical protein